MEVRKSLRSMDRSENRQHQYKRMDEYPFHHTSHICHIQGCSGMQDVNANSESFVLFTHGISAAPQGDHTKCKAPAEGFGLDSVGLLFFLDFFAVGETKQWHTQSTTGLFSSQNARQAQINGDSIRKISG